MQHTQKLLSVLLVLAMILSLLPAAAAASGGTVVINDIIAVDDIRNVGATLTFNGGTIGDPNSYAGGQIDASGDSVVIQGPADFILYYDNTTTQWNTVYIYAWNDNGNITNSWPGDRMTLVDGETSIYYAQLSGETSKIIFNNGSGTQTGDIDVAGLTGNMYDHSTGQWTTFESDIVACTHESHGTDGKCTACGRTVGHTYVDGTCSCGAAEPENTDRVIYLKNEANWGTVYAYIWTTANGSTTQYNGAWPGAPMTAVPGQNGYYSVTVPSDAANIIFHNNSGTQTADLSIPADKDLYNNATNDWSNMFIGPACPHSYTSVVTAPTCTTGGYTTHTCTLCGNSYTDGNVAALGHTPGEPVENVTKTPTCTEPGEKSITTSCVTCGEALSGDGDMIPALGHSYVDGVCGTCGKQQSLSGTCGENLTWELDSDGTLTVSGSGAITKCESFNYPWSKQRDTIKKIIVESGVTTIPDEAFGFMSNVTEVTISDTITVIGTMPFAYDESLIRVTVDSSNPSYASDASGALLSKDGTQLIYVPHALTQYEIPSTVTQIGFAAFHTSKLTSISIPEGVTHIAASAFMGSEALTEAVLPAGLVKIEGHAFDCPALKTVTFLGSAPTFGSEVFYSAVATVYYPAGNSTWTENVKANHGGTLTWVGLPSATVPSVQIVAPGLAFKEEIYYNIYFSVNNPDNIEIVETGLISWTSSIDGTIDTAECISAGAVSYSSEYLKSRSNPIPAKNMGDDLYMKVYLKLADGTYVYSQLVNYSAKTYAMNMLANEEADASIKALCVAMLNYGAAAQDYFGYKTDDLMNAGLTDEQKALVSDYSEDMIPALNSAETDIVRNGGFKDMNASVNFGGALGINYSFNPSKVMDGEMKLYVWTSADEALTFENASQVLTMEERAGMYTARVGAIAARNAGNTIYVCGVYESDGVQYTTGVLTYSVSAYCKAHANTTGAFQTMAASTAVYTYYADAHFRNASETPVQPPEDPVISGTYIVGEDELPYSDEEIYQQLFDPNTKLEINLDMSNEELQKLQDDYRRYRDMGSKSPIYRLGNMTITMTTEQGTVSYVIKEVGARMKGNTSRTSFYDENDGIYNYIHFKFDFQETFDDEDYYGADCKVWDSEEARDARKDRTFATLEKLEMRWNKLYDATYLKESYAYDIYRSEGILAPQCNIGVLDWSGARMGIYTVEEPVDKVFIERHVSEEDAGGDLYKLGWTNEGATFTNTGSIGVEDEDKGQFYIYDLKTNKKKSTHKDLINLINTLNSGPVTKESFASVVDVDNFLRFAAVSYFMGNPDDLRNNYNNCYVYFLKSSGKAVFIPYDFDRCLGVNREYNPNGNSMTRDNPYGEGNQQSPLFRYSVDKGGFYTAEYTKVLLEVAENELLTADAFARRFAIAEGLYADQVTPERYLKNAEGRDFSFDLERTGSASGGSNMSFKDYMDAKMAAFREYMGQSDDSTSKCYIRGDFNGWAIDPGFAMKQQDDTLVFTLDFDYRFAFKVYNDVDGSWMGTESLSTDTAVAWDTDDHGNIILNAGTYQVRYDPASKQITITQ